MAGLVPNRTEHLRLLDLLMKGNVSFNGVKPDQGAQQFIGKLDYLWLQLHYLQITWEVCSQVSCEEHWIDRYRTMQRILKQPIPNMLISA